MNKTNCYRITIEEITSDEKVATQIGVGLRLLGTMMMMQHRKHPLFSDFMPHFKAFIINLKSTLKNNKASVN